MKKTVYFVTGVALILSGCMSIQNHQALDAVSNAQKAGQPFVEGYFEYVGPRDKWVGPKSFLVHVTAREAGGVDITSTSQPDSHYKGTMQAEEFRKGLADLATAIQSDDAKFAGCLSPVRVRFIRQDGTFVEAQGCRSYTGWPAVVSRAVNEYMVALNTKPVPDSAARKPADVEK